LGLEVPAWSLPPGVLALTSTRAAGASAPPFDAFNLAAHVGDAPASVCANRGALARRLPAGAHLRWLRQVHGTVVLDDADDPRAQAADGIVTRRAGEVCAVLTADCLPVLFCADDGSVVGAAHAGWRGLAAGVLERTVAALGHPPDRLLAWLGPAIGAAAFEVGPEVRDACLEGAPGSRAAVQACFAPGAGDRLHADLQGLARQRLAAAGVRQLTADSRCTVSEPARFFSYRRDGVTGRMASLILITL
jgi:YfiH family protein